MQEFVLGSTHHEQLQSSHHQVLTIQLCVGFKGDFFQIPCPPKAAQGLPLLLLHLEIASSEDAKAEIRGCSIPFKPPATRLDSSQAFPGMTMPLTAVS